MKKTIKELRKIKSDMEKSANVFGFESNHFYTGYVHTINKAIIACEQLKKARKKAKRWKQKYLDLQENYEIMENDFQDVWDEYVLKGGEDDEV